MLIKAAFTKSAVSFKVILTNNHALISFKNSPYQQKLNKNVYLDSIICKTIAER